MGEAGKVIMLRKEAWQVRGEEGQQSRRVAMLP